LITVIAVIAVISNVFTYKLSIWQ